MDLAAIRTAIAAGVTADATLGLHGYSRPPGTLSALPCAIVRDPARIQYHRAMGKKLELTVPVLAVVGRSAGSDVTGRLDEIMSDPAGLPALLEGLTSAEWESLTVDELAGGYVDIYSGKQLVGLGAALTTTIICKP